MPGESPEQRQARLQAAYAVQARIDAQQRAEEAARAQLAVPMQTMPPKMIGIPPPPAVAPAPTMGNPDPGFDINTATNTFYRSLADRVKSGQMTVPQAQEAQAAMRQLQLNPQMATRQAATDLAQRDLLAHDEP